MLKISKNPSELPYVSLSLIGKPDFDLVSGNATKYSNQTKMGGAHPPI